MNYLQLAQRLRQEAGVPGTGPTAVTSQTGELLRLVDWVATAWRELQNKHINWRWMRRSFTFTTTTGQSEYASTAATDTTDAAAISRFARWISHDDYGCVTVSIYETATGVSAQRWLIYMPWDSFRGLYRFSAQTNGVPAHFSITPANKIAIGPAPNATGYTVAGDYQMGAQELSANGDTPDMPVRFHLLIVYEALKKYAAYDAAGEVYAVAKAESDSLMFRLESDQLPEIIAGASIA